MSEARILSFDDALRARDAGRPPTLDLDVLKQRQASMPIGSYHAAFNKVSYIKHLKTRDIPYFQDLSLAIPRGRKIAILSHRDSGSREFQELLTRRIAPAKGSVTIESRISWIIPEARFFDNLAPLRENAIFFSHVLGVDASTVMGMMLAVGELPPAALHEPLKNLPPWAVKRLSLVLLHFCQFDLHLVGSRFQIKAMKLDGEDAAEVLNLIYGRDYLVTIEDPKGIPYNCNLLYVLYEGVLYEFEDLEEGAAVFEALPKPIEGPRAEKDREEENEDEDFFREEFF